MNNTFWNKKFPTVLGLIIILLGIIGTSYFVRTGVFFRGQAAPDETPRNIRITNVTDVSFSVSFSTTEQVTGALSYGKDQTLGQITFDDRNEQNGSIAEYKTHHITVKNLEPQTRYFFAISSGQKTYLDDKNPFEVITGRQLEKSSQQSTLKGKILSPQETSRSQALIYIKTPESQTLSTLAKDDGTFEISIDNMRTADLQSLVELSNSTTVEMLLTDEKYESKVKVFAKRKEIIPTVILSKNYDFTIPVIDSKDPIATSSSFLDFPAFVATSSAEQGVDPKIQTPRKDERFTDDQPLFRGTAQPNAEIKIIIHSDENIEDSIQSDRRGLWTYRPKNPLSSGTHTISIITKDRFGILTTITQSFVVQASGSQISQSATSSASPTIVLPTATSTPKPTAQITKPVQSPTPTPIPTIAIPTVTEIPTPTITREATIPPSPEVTLEPSQTLKGGNPPDEPGNEIVGISTIAIGSILIISTLLFLLSRGGSPL